eukprot:CAMPEP_0198250430 /NCGR_PEP_ID=MMETSP1447-20131203/1630_1 /TAXON_ID=420782 /ORGANISM="Chaetoceros dichaeta, Strain CCMP1751" /LENGTH=325 /DNA_ID=CAMNT_0043935269 /DNA_START=213 /DNA_END=1190 /DNA_ORIENTATION=-
METPTTVKYEVLEKQNAATSDAIINLYSSSSDFNGLAKVEGDAILARDQEDAEKLQVGIDYSKKRGVIDPNFVPEPYVEIDVLGKSPEHVCDTIIGFMAADTKTDDVGSVIVICGLSGTGKGTAVARLSERLSTTHQVVSWSNGNIFRSLTLLAATWCEQNLPNGTFDATQALTDQNLASFISMLTFDKFDGKFDTRIHGLGLDLLVSDIQNTILKQPKVSKNIPTVAEKTQGEVILFAANAIQIMSEGGVTILLEGREQTVNYVRTPMRFTLTLSDETLIGKRRAAQRLMAAALGGDLTHGSTEDEVKNVLDQELAKLLLEIDN